MNLLDQIQNAQRDAGEAAVIAHLDSLGLSNVTDKKDPYASEEETKALLVPDTRSEAERKLAAMMAERGADEQGAEPSLILRQIALGLLEAQTFTGLPKRKLSELVSAGWNINGVSIEREEGGVTKRGAVTTGGMVLWWNQEPTGSMGMPESCGKPLCSPGDHHPLCKLAEQPAQPQQSCHCLNCEELSKELAALKKQPQIACCAECGKKDSDGWALYCVECMDRIHAILDSAEKKLDALIAQKTPTPSPKNHGDI